MLGLFLYIWSYSGWFHMLDYGFYLAIIGVFLVGRTKLEKTGFPFLYLGTGLSLCWVAVEKWVYPYMTTDIIERHGVPTFGFAPELFVVLSAFIEFVVGYLLVVGILNRLLAVARNDLIHPNNDDLWLHRSSGTCDHSYCVAHLYYRGDILL